MNSGGGQPPEAPQEVASPCLPPGLGGAAGLAVRSLGHPASQGPSTGSFERPREQGLGVG
jgi:hypothetical protein